MADDHDVFVYKTAEDPKAPEIAVVLTDWGEYELVVRRKKVKHHVAKFYSRRSVTDFDAVFMYVLNKSGVAIRPKP